MNGSATRESRQLAHVAIIGCGFTGTTALYQLVRRYPVERISVFEASGEFGPGFPYRLDESPHYLLNNSNDTMCLEPSNRRAFFEWLQRQPQYATDLDPKGSLPRAVYGEFLKDAIEQSKAVARARGIRIDMVAAEVVDLDEDNTGRVRIYFDHGMVDADLALLEGRLRGLS